ncbi:MAG: YdjY domain-containing protein [Planctomycetota bacterium]
MRILACLSVVLCCAAFGFSQQATEPAQSSQSATTKPAPADKLADAPQKPEKPAPGLPHDADARGFLPLGTVRFHPEQKVIEVDGFFNLRAGFIEFLACLPGRKAHETLVSADCDPEHLQAALLLLGLEEGKPPETETDTRAIAGPRVIVELRWQQKGKDGVLATVQKRAEECVFNGLVSESMEPVGFVFTGSRFLREPILPVTEEEKDATGADEDKPAGDSKAADTGAGDTGAGDSEEAPPTEPLRPGEKIVVGEDGKMRYREVFGATLTGQLIALSHRPLAILDNPLELPFPDADYYADPDVIPPLDRQQPTAVTLIIRLPRDGEIDRSIKAMKVPPRPERPAPTPNGGEEPSDEEQKPKDQ